MEQNATKIRRHINDTNKATSPQESCISVPASSLFSFMDRKRKNYKIYYLKNRDKIIKKRKARGYDKKYYKINKERINLRKKIYLENHPDMKEKASFQAKVRLSNFKITHEEYKKLVKKHKGICAICLGKNKLKRDLAIDHCHKTGKIRGLLCMKCNRGLGFFNDDPQILMQAIKYLNGHI